MKKTENLIKNFKEKIVNNEELRKELETFLGCDEIESISEKVSGFNPFRVLNLEHYEIRHSNFLAWLLNPNESHQLKETFLKGFLEKVFEKDELENIDFEKIEIKREWNNIDILIKGKNFVCAVENKIHCGEHGNQLDKYANIIKEKFPDEKIIKKNIYLTLNQQTPTNDKYVNITYSDTILPTIKRIIGKNKEIDKEIKNFLQYYVTILEYDLQCLHYFVNILEYDSQLNNTDKANCDEISKISKEHRKILDYLYEIKDSLSDICFADDSLNELFKQKTKAINVIFSFQRNLQDARDKEIGKILKEIFKSKYVAMHGRWANKLELKTQKYPFRQVDYTTRPFEDIKVRFYCGITANESKQLVQKIKTNENFTEDLKSLKKHFGDNFEIQTGIYFKYKGSQSLINEFLIKENDDKVYEFIEFLNSKDFDKKYIGEWKKKSNNYFQDIWKNNFGDFFKDAEEKFKDVSDYNEEHSVIFLPVLYLFFTVDENNKKELFRKYTEEGFEIFNIGADFKNLLLTSDKT